MDKIKNIRFKKIKVYQKYEKNTKTLVQIALMYIFAA